MLFAVRQYRASELLPETYAQRRERSGLTTSEYLTTLEQGCGREGGALSGPHISSAQGLSRTEQVSTQFDLQVVHVLSCFCSRVHHSRKYLFLRSCFRARYRVVDAFYDRGINGTFRLIFVFWRIGLLLSQSLSSECHSLLAKQNLCAYLGHGFVHLGSHFQLTPQCFFFGWGKEVLKWGASGKEWCYITD